MEETIKHRMHTPIHTHRHLNCVLTHIRNMKQIPWYCMHFGCTHATGKANNNRELVKLKLGLQIVRTNEKKNKNKKSSKKISRKTATITRIEIQQTHRALHQRITHNNEALKIVYFMS